MDNLFESMITWGFLGTFLLTIMPEPKTDAGAFFQVIICGPFIWIMGICYLIWAGIKKILGR